ncbi:antilisterial bacteriocin subtilosin biosynthesis protein AlbA [bacterium BMS3Abin13]|nr:antilisterial bacteriocin subtilosin biosynthesis protein AlbA [bacterium BMS3Abin13]
MTQSILEPDLGDEFYFQWHLTERCNRACRHCYQDGKPAPELALDDLFRIVDLMEEAVRKWEKQGTLSLTGGEPFLRRDDLYALMDRIDRSDLLAYYDILTNGSLITAEEAKKLARQSKLRRVQVSLEGATAGTNDAVRGTGSFNATIKAIRHMRKAGIDVAIMTTISRLNYKEIPELIKLAGDEGAVTLALERLIPEGAGEGMTDQVLSPDELRNLYEQVYAIAVNGAPVRVLLYRPLFALIAPDDHTVGALCSAGNNALTIMPDGTIYPCRRLPIPIGNVLTDGFFKIWYGSDVLWRLRNPKKLGGKCGDCSLLTQCRGCRAMAYFTTGDYMAEDPQCWC